MLRAAATLLAGVSGVGGAIADAPTPLAAAAAAAAPPSPSPSPPPPPSPSLSILCNFSLASGATYDLAAFRGAVVRGTEAAGAEVRLSLCGDLARPCVDALTKVPINGSAMVGPTEPAWRPAPPTCST